MIIQESRAFLKEGDAYNPCFVKGAIKKGEIFNVAFLLENDSKEQKEGYTSLLLDSQSSFQVIQGKNSSYYDLKAGEKMLAIFQVVAKKDMEAGDHKVSLLVETMKDGVIEENKDTISSSFTLVEREEEISKEEMEKVKIFLKLWREGKIKISEATIEVVEQNNDKPSEKPQEKPGEKPQEITGEEPNILLPGHQMDIPSVPMDIPDDITGGSGGETTVKNKPKLIISNYKLMPEMAKAGEEFTMDLTFYNTNSDKSVRNIKISLNGAETNNTAQGQPAQGSVFAPSKSSNTFFIDYIAPGETASKSISLKTVPNAPAQNYIMNVVFEYEDKDGNEYTATEVIGVPVVQQSQILIGEAKVEDTQVGSSTTLMLDFYNTGKDSLTNFMVTLEGEGFNIESSSRYFVGNFAPGSSDQFSIDIMPIEAGEVSGKVVLTYEDSTGKEHKEEAPFKFQATEMMTEELIDPETGMPLNDPMEPPSSGPSLPMIIVGVAIVAGIIIALLVRRHRKKKQQAVDLTIDE